MNHGRIVSNDGLDIAATAWETMFEERQVAVVERAAGHAATTASRTCSVQRLG